MQRYKDFFNLQIFFNNILKNFNYFMKNWFLLVSFALLLLAGCGGKNPRTSSEYVREVADSLIVNTTVPGASVEGYRGAVPLEVVVYKGKVADIRVLDNSETPRYLRAAFDGLKGEWIGKSVAKASKAKPDAVSGATYTSNAIIYNMKIALSELQKK